MTNLNRSSVETLLNHEGDSVSIFVPAQIGTETQQARIRLKNLLRAAEARLTARGRSAGVVQATLRPGHDLLEEEPFWQATGRGVALFLAPELARRLELPWPVEESLVVGNRFYLLPILPWIEAETGFFVLALSRKSVRLFMADRHRAEEIDLPGVPGNLTDAVGSDWEQDAIQVHTVRPGAGGAIVHGHGGSQGEVDKEEATRFCQRVDAGLRSLLDGGQRPLVLAAAEPLASIYRQVSRYPNLTPDVVAGNPELRSGEELRLRAATVLEPIQARQIEAEVERCRGLLGTGRATTDIREIVRDAFDGRVGTLLVADGARRWGRWDPVSRHLELHDEARADSEEILNLAAVLGMRSGATVRLVASDRLPEARTAAILRY
jgi:hypothetical protein